MVPFLRTALLGLLATSATVHAEHLKVVWSAGDFSTISGPAGGNQNGHYAGFAIINDAGEAIYNDGTPDDHSPCYNTGDGHILFFILSTKMFPAIAVVLPYFLIFRDIGRTGGWALRGATK